MVEELEGALREFLVESYENLDQLDRDLVVLEKNPGDAARLASVFRTVHTIKGTCGFFEFAKLGALTHAGENLLDLLRNGKLRLTPGIASALLTLTDELRGSLQHIEKRSAESADDFAPLIARLNSLAAGDAPAPPPPEEPVDSALEDMLSGLAEGSIRVDVTLLDRLMNLVGELVLARNQILQMTAAQPDAGLLQSSQRLNLITTELQEGVMKTRMQPIGNVWSKFPRVVRDIALSCGKEVRVTLDGKETELDKTILEAIKGPLTHLVRNSIDHGLETPADRKKAGKSEAGHLHLRAFHEGGQVIIEVSDDGRGMDAERIRAKAVERGLIGPEQAARLGERELLRLVFLPGFSTAEKVTSLSGRGVGMDVVKTNIEKIGGTVDIQSRPGEGTTVKLKIPLTLAIIPALLVSSGGDRYAIPQVNLLELVHLDAEQARTQVESLYGTAVYRLRGNLLPLVYLDDLLKVDRQREPDGTSVVVLQADGRLFGLVVDGIHDTEEIVVKPLGKHLKAVPLFAGATIMGDGQVVLILDTLGVAQASGVVSEGREQARAAAAREEAAPEQRETLLVFEVGRDGRAALPLGSVARLEEFPRSAVEKASGQPVVQYRGKLLPLVPLARVCPWAEARPEADGPLQVVVCADQQRQVGLVVDRILDIVETTLDVTLGRGTGLLGTAVVQQRVTDLLDVAGLMASVGGRA
ncbi:MAG: chemotaxis protein CheW [Gemmataceae bacterium]|nr:chemotaxis protein CheW [Gemmataceae bacterium]